MHPAPSRRLSALTGLLLLVALAGCSRCGGPKVDAARTPASWLPAESTGALWIPRLDAVGAHLHGLGKLKLAGLGAQLAGAGEAEALFGAVSRPLGFDPSTPEGLKAAGLDGTRPVAVAATGTQELLSVLPIADAAAFEATLARLAKDRLQAPTRKEEAGVVTFAKESNGPVLIAHAPLGLWDLFSAGPGCEVRVKAALARAAAQSLEGNATFTAAIASGSALDALAWMPAGSPFLARTGIANGLRLGLSLDPAHPRVVADVGLDTAQATGLASLKGEGGAAERKSIDPSAVLLVRSALDPATLWPIAEALVPRGLRQRLETAGLPLTAQITNLKPGLAFGLALAEGADLSRMPEIDPRRTNPFQYVTLSGAGRVKDPAVSRAGLEALTQHGEAVGARIEKRAVPHGASMLDAWVFTYALGEGASLSLEGESLLVSGGTGEFSRLLARRDDAKATGPLLPAALEPRFQQAGAAAWFDLARASARIRAVPDSAYGLGGFAIRAAVERWLNAIDELSGLMVLADYRPEGTPTLHLELELVRP